MKEGDIWTTTFNTKGGLYEWLVMSFRLSNSPSTFVKLMNEILRSFVDRFVVLYFDDILVYSKNEEEHVSHLKYVFEALRNQKLYAKMEKCQFFSTSIVFLGQVLSKDGISIDQFKVEAVKTWPESKLIFDLRSFCGLASFF